MRISKGLVIGLCAALLAGALEAVGESVVRAEQGGSEASTTPVVVPIGHLGDRVAYARFTRTLPSPTWERTSEPGYFEGDRTYQVTGTGQQADATGAPHQVVFVSTNFTLHLTNGLPGEQSKTTQAVSSEAVDLATRDLIGYRTDGESTGNAFFVRSDVETQGSVLYGPFEGHHDVVGPNAYEKNQLVRHQGRTYAPQASPTNSGNEILVSQAAYIRSTYNAVGLHDSVVETHVAERGTIGSWDVVAVRTSGCTSLEVTDPKNVWWWGYAPEVEFFGFTTPVPSRACFEVTEWLSDAVPYPVLTEVRSTINETVTHESRTSLAAFDPGEVLIPWSARTDSAYRTSDPNIERSPANQRYPADGRATEMSFPLGAALRAIGEDPTLLQYVAWRTLNPSAEPLGARLNPTGAQGLGRMWTITMGVPGRVAFIVQSELPQPGAIPLQTEIGERSLQGRSTAPPPASPITFAALEARWKEVFTGSAASLAPNSGAWGLVYGTGGVRCTSSDSCGPQSDWFYTGFDGNDMYLLRSQDPTSTSGRAYSAIGPECCSPLMLYASASSGTTYFHREFKRDIRVEPLPIADSYEAPQPQTTSEAPAATVLALQHGALVSSSLLVLLLVGYFLPTLKFIGTRALFVLPGYAKIQKSDVLHNKVRETMVAAIRMDPGVTAPKLQELTGAGWSTVVYHLGVLEKNRIVSSLLDGRHRRFFPVDSVNWSDRTRLVALKNARTRELYDAILGEPGVGLRELSARVGISRPALYWHVDRLTSAGLVGQDVDGTKRRFYANQVAEPYDANEAREVA